jgi:hypothetical protein
MWVWTFIDNFLLWLWIFFWQFSSMAVNSRFYFTILLVFVSKFLGNFSFWQKNCNPTNFITHDPLALSGSDSWAGMSNLPTPQQKIVNKSSHPHWKVVKEKLWLKTTPKNWQIAFWNGFCKKIHLKIGCHNLSSPNQI